MLRASDFSIRVDGLATGPNNLITDVPGVRVGHCTVEGEGQRTGVTAVLAGDHNPFAEKNVANAHVLNGFGKSLGLMQVQELGTLETPILLTNTLNVGLVHDAAVSYMLELCRRDGLECHSVNPVVLECNDARLSDIQRRAVGREEVFWALNTASRDFALGAVGAGRGTVCFGFKGGIGSASRRLRLDGKDYTLGVLVQTNHGRMDDLRIDGRQPFAGKDGQSCDKGSVIIVMATDLPLSSRQLGRVLRRGSVGLARLGSFIGHGSGEVFVGFTTANRMPNEGGPAALPLTVLREDLLDEAFRAMAFAVEEAVLLSMLCAGPETDRNGRPVPGLRQELERAGLL